MPVNGYIVSFEGAKTASRKGVKGQRNKICPGTLDKLWDKEVLSWGSSVSTRAKNGLLCGKELWNLTKRKS